MIVRRRSIGLAGLCLLCVTLGRAAMAQERFFVGARNMGMGGTGVGGSTDALSVYFNPAGMAFAPGWEVQVPLIAANAEIDGTTFSDIDTLHDLFQDKSLQEIQADLDNGTATREDLRTILNAFLYVVPSLNSTSDGATVRGTAGPAFRWKNWGVSANALVAGGADATVDLTAALALGAAGFLAAIPSPTPDACGGDSFCLGFADELIDATNGLLDQDRAEELAAAAGPQLENDPSAQGLLIDIVEATAAGLETLGDNPSAAVTTGIFVSQVAFTYSHKILGDKLAVGGNVKLMKGETFFTVTRVGALADGEETFRDILDQDNTRSDTDYGLDLGVMYRPAPRFSVGLSAMNLNSPTFQLSEEGRDITLDPLVRVGGTYSPLKWLNLAADLDVNEVSSQVVSGLGYRYVNLGVEFLLGRWFQGWVGAYSNLARSSSEPTITGGVGFGLGRFTLSLAAAVSLDSVRLTSGEDQRSFPQGAGAALQLGWRPGKGAH